MINTAKRLAHLQHWQTPAKFQKGRAKAVGGVAFTIYSVSICFSPKMTKLKLQNVLK